MLKTFLALSLCMVCIGNAAAAESQREPFDDRYCTTCHGTDGRGNEGVQAPRLAGMESWYLRRQLENFRGDIRGVHAEDKEGIAMRPMATKLTDGKITFFAHNDPDALEEKLRASGAKRKIIAVEGIYSMDGDLLDREIIALSENYDAILIVDEAHSSGVVGPNLMGVFDHYGIDIHPNHIKMGTLGKAYGSFGAYILASEHIIDYLINRAKPIIYATAPSLFDTLLGHRALVYIASNTEMLRSEIGQRRRLVKEILDVEVPGLIVPVEVGDNRRVMSIRDTLLDEGIVVGAIRQPTVEKAIIRLIARLGVDENDLRRACERISQNL